MQAFDAEAFVRKCFSEHANSRVNDDDAGELAERVECLVAELHAAMGGRGDDADGQIHREDGVALLSWVAPTTRGHVRNIIAALGIPLPAAPGERSGE